LASSLAARLAEAGFGSGDRALIWFENSIDYITAYLAVLQLGGIVTALHAKSLPTEVSRAIHQVAAKALMTAPATWRASGRHFENAGLSFVVTSQETFKLAGSTSAREAPDGLAQIVFTSGTTGQSKGVMLTHANLIANTQAILASLPITHADSIVAVLPFVFVYGNSVMLTHLFAGGKLIIQNNLAYPNLIIDRMAEEDSTGFSGVASNYAFLLRHSAFNAGHLPSLRYFTSAGGTMPSELLHRVQEAFAGTEFYVMYGQTEATARLTVLPAKDLISKYGSAGLPVPGVSIRIVKEDGSLARPDEIGEITVAGDNVMKGYWGDPEASSRVLRNGHLYTGDLGYLDEEGYLFIRGRKSEMIKSGAFRISPNEIEEILFQHPDVHEAAVVGIDDPMLGEAIVGLVVPKQGMTPSSRDILAHAARKLPPFKRPKAVFLVKELPKSANGKILRQPVREQCQELMKSHGTSKRPAAQTAPGRSIIP
jgi:acyl-CoA synthetase (AMP-forming)/AMP-acid ligase II